MKLFLPLLLCMVLSAQAPTVLTGGSVIRNAVIAPAVAGNDPVFNSLTHYWSLDESSGTRADSKGAINLTETGGAVSSGTGIDGNCISIASSHYLHNASAVYPGSGNASISMWFKATNPGIGNVIFATAGADPVVDINNGTVGVGDGNNGNDLDTSDFTPDIWQLVIITSNGSSLYWSLNGGAQSLFDTAVGAPSADINPGIIWTSGTILIDEIGIWNVKLSDADCTTLWNSGAGKFYRP